MTQPEELSEREARAWYGLLTMQEDLRRHLNRQLLRDSELSVADFAILSGLSQQPDGSLRVFELRELLRWEKTRVTHQISRMIARGLLERRVCAEDNRGLHVALTEAGREAIAKATPLHQSYVRRVFFDAVTPRQLDALAALSEAVLESLRKDGDDD